MGAQEWTIAWLAQEDCNGEAIVDIMAQDLDLFVFNPSLKDIYQQVLAMREHARMQAQTQPAQAAHRPGPALTWRTQQQAWYDETMNTPAATIFNDPSALATVKRIDALKKKERLGILTQQDLDALDERGCSPLSSVLEDYSKLGPAWRQDTILWLIKAGATLIGNDDPFSKLVNMSGQQQNLVLINRAIEHMLSHGGKNNPMFHLASGMPGYIAASPSLNVANKDEVEHIRKAWFVDTDEQGRTVSHHLWGENTILEMYHRSYCCADEGDKKTLESLWRRTHRVCWDVQNRLHDAGLHMGQADHSGTTALDLLQARIAQGQAFIDDAIAQEFPAAAVARSMIEQQALDRDVLQPTYPSAKRHGRL